MILEPKYCRWRSSAPHMPIDVQDLDADFYVFSVINLRPHRHRNPIRQRRAAGPMPPCQGGGDMIETVTFDKTTYNVLPMKFEAGTPMIAEVIGLGAAIDYLSMKSAWRPSTTGNTTLLSLCHATASRKSRRSGLSARCPKRGDHQFCSSKGSTLWTSGRCSTCTALPSALATIAPSRSCAISAFLALPAHRSELQY